MPFGPEYSEEEIEMVKRYTGFVTELATYGQPTGGDPEKVYKLEWNPYKRGNGQVNQTIIAILMARLVKLIFVSIFI